VTLVRSSTVIVNLVKLEVSITPVQGGRGFSSHHGCFELHWEKCHFWYYKIRFMFSQSFLKHFWSTFSKSFKNQTRV